MAGGFCGATDRLLDIGTPLKRLRVRPFFRNEVVTLLRTVFLENCRQRQVR